MSSRGGAGKRGGRGGARGGGGSGRGKARGGASANSNPRQPTPQQTRNPEADRIREEQEQVKRMERERTRLEEEKREAEERAKRAEIDRLQQEEQRKRATELRRKQEEETARRNQEEAARRERQRLEDQRKRQEENIRRQREAVLREEQERQKEYEKMQKTLQKDKETMMRGIATEKADRARIEALRKEVDNRQVTPLKRKVEAPVRAQPPAQRPRLSTANSSATFAPEDPLDYSVLKIYEQRAPVVGKDLPAVPFSKKGESLYFLGARKCSIEVVNGTVCVKLGSTHEEFSSWLDKAERVEALRIRSLKSANNLFTLQQAGAFSF